MSEGTKTPNITLGEIQRVLGINPVERPLPGDIALKVRTANDGIVGFIIPTRVTPVDPATAGFEAANPSYVSRDGYVVSNGAERYYTKPVSPYEFRAVCFRPDGKVTSLQIIRMLMDAGVDEIEPLVFEPSETDDGYKAKDCVPYAFP